jgi:hypothetical protein
VPLEFQVGEALTEFEVLPDSTLRKEPDCPEADQEPLSFGLDTQTPLSGHITQLTPIAGNCFLMNIGDVAVDGEGGASGAAGAGGAEGGAPGNGGGSFEQDSVVRVYVCAPLELIPLEAGDYVTVNKHALEGPTLGSTLPAEALTVAGADAGFRIVNAEFPNNYNIAPYAIRDSGCDLRRDSEQHVWQPVKVSQGRSQLVPGQLVPAARDDLDKQFRLEVYLGRARNDVFWSCGGVVGASVELMERWSR